MAVTIGKQNVKKRKEKEEVAIQVMLQSHKQKDFSAYGGSK